MYTKTEINKDEIVFGMARKMHVSLHRFKDSNSYFHKGFKFMEEWDSEDKKTYSSFNIRSQRYVRLSDFELDLIIKYGINNVSEYLSYVYYKGKVVLNEKIISNRRSGYKVIEKAQRAIVRHNEECARILEENPIVTEILELI